MFVTLVIALAVACGSIAPLIFMLFTTVVEAPNPLALAIPLAGEKSVFDTEKNSLTSYFKKSTYC